MYSWIRIPTLSLLLLLALSLPASEAACNAGCDLALASYYIIRGQTLGEIGPFFNIAFGDLNSAVKPYNPAITDINVIEADSRVNIPFPACDCIDKTYLGHAFRYTVQSNDTYTSIATDRYHNLTTADWLARSNTAPATNLQPGQNISVIVNCSCGNSAIYSDYGLFLTYALRAGDTLQSVAGAVGFTQTELIQRYNPGVDFSAGRGIVFLPVKDSSGSYRPLISSAGISRVAIAGIIVAVLILLALVVGLCILVNKRKRTKKAQLLKSQSEDQSISYQRGSPDSSKNNLIPTSVAGGVSPFSGITVDKSVEFSYEELANATDDFNMKNKIGEGGFGAVYYAELRGEKTAIKRMDMKDSKEFLSELKVLTRVHHLNLVRLIGYCTEGSLFLVYEYMENGNLSQHLRGSERAVLPWAVRVQIALDSARGLEYIHEHTVPVYIHRDIKSPNILLDKNFHAKVADFGLAKLTEVGNTSQTRLVGTFGYMPPEYAQFGDVSPKIDVYAFGVVLYELISAKEAVVKTDATVTESKGLVALFEGVLSQPDSTEELHRLVDQRLGDTYPIDAVHKMAQLAKACTHEDPQLRPSMRSVVVALMTLLSSTEDWDGASFYDNQALANLVSGR